MVEGLGRYAQHNNNNCVYARVHTHTKSFKSKFLFDCETVWRGGVRHRSAPHRAYLLCVPAKQTYIMLRNNISRRTPFQSCHLPNRSDQVIKVWLLDLSVDLGVS